MSDKDCVRDVVVKRLLDAVMSNYSSFVSGMSHVREVGVELSVIDVLCSSARHHLERASKDLVHSSFAVLSKRRKKMRMQMLKGIFMRVDWLLAQEENVQRAVEGGRVLQGAHLFKAIGDVLEGRDGDEEEEEEVEADEDKEPTLEQRILSEVHCLEGFRKRRPQLRAQLEELLANKVFEGCAVFDRDSFVECLEAHALLTKASAINASGDIVGQSSEDLLLLSSVSGTAAPASASNATRARFMDFSALLRDKYLLAARHVSMRAVVRTIAGDDDEEASSLMRCRYKDLCGRVGTHRMEECFTQVLEALVDVLYSFFKTYETMELLVEERPELELSAVLEAKHSTAVQLWGKCQVYATSLLSSGSYTTLTIPLEQFMSILHSAHQFVAIGERFAGGAPAASLRGSIHQKSKEYVENFHREKFEYLRVALRNEVWRFMGLPSSFGLRDVKELRHVLTLSSAASAGVSTSSGASTDAEPATAPSEEQRAEESGPGALLYSQFVDGVNIFRPRPAQDPLDEPVAEDEAPQQEAAAAAEESEDTVSDAGAEPSSVRQHLRRLKRAASGLNSVDRLLDDGDESEATAPVVTQSTLHVARFIGQYVNIMHTLPNYALNALYGLAELFDCYIYTVFNMFGVRAHTFYDKKFNPRMYWRLRAAVICIRGRIESEDFGRFQLSNKHLQKPVFMTVDVSQSEETGTLTSAGVDQLPQFKAGGGGSSDSESSQASSSTSSRFRKLRSSLSMTKVENEPVPAPELVRLHSNVDLESRETLHGLIERYTATESLQFIISIFEQLEHRIALLLPRHQQFLAAKFLQYVRAVTEDLQVYMVRNLATLMLPMEPVKQMIVARKWDVRGSVGTGHSPYVEKTLTGLIECDAKLRTLGGLPDHMRAALWRETVAYVMEQLLDGYAAVKKCSNEGRGVMSVDMMELKSGLEALTGLKPLPKWHFVHTWVQAFYHLNEEDFLAWMREHPGYKLQHYLSIANTGLGAAMKKKQRLAFVGRVKALHEEMERVV